MPIYHSNNVMRNDQDEWYLHINRRKLIFIYLDELGLLIFSLQFHDFATQ